MRRNVNETSRIREVTVYCGSGPGNDPAFIKGGHDLGEVFCRENIKGRFGGGSIGVMGAFASSVMGHGGHLTAVIPDLLVCREQPMREGTPPEAGSYTLIKTADMYERKRKFREADGFIVLPGGAGTRDELWEELTGIQIGDHQKPIVVVNILDHFKYVLLDIEQMREQMFIRPGLEFDTLFAVVNTVEEALPKLRHMVGETNVVDLVAPRQATG